MLQKNLCADLLKMKRLPVTLAHILIPVIISGIFLSYYSFSAWSDQTKVVAFYQAVGPGFDRNIYSRCGGTGAKCRRVSKSAYVT